jgi:hypothetical protein
MNEHPDRKAFQMEDVRELRRKADERQAWLKEHGGEMSHSEWEAEKKEVKELIATLDELEKGINETDRIKAQMEVMRSKIDPIVEGNDSLPPFDQDSVSDDQRGNFMALKDSYLKHGNAYALIDIFCLVVLLSKMSPPAWVLEPLARRFGKYIVDGEGDSKSLAKSLELMGGGRFLQAWKRREEISPAINEMHALIGSFGLKKEPAAKAVKLKHKLSESVSTLERYYDDMYADLKGVDIFRYQDNEVQRTKFLTSFPPEARTIIRKKKRSR